MDNPDNNPEDPHPITTADNEAVRHFKQSITEGKHWYIGLLEAIGLWETAEETIDERTYKYIIAGEAFDWLLLAERLCETAKELVPESEKCTLLFHNRPPLDLNAEEFKKLLGLVKYNRYLNYFYGITTEEALITAIENEVRKERRLSGYMKEPETIDETYRRIYGSTKDVLLRQFRKEKNYKQLKSVSLTELKEFTYWLFKHRLKHCDSSRIASDTKKALDWLDDSGYFRLSSKQDIEVEIIDTPPAESV
ncbi:hypothetical protein ACFLYN_01335 [Chloroflexota bacterium]